MKLKINSSVSKGNSPSYDSWEDVYEIFIDIVDTFFPDEVTIEDKVKQFPTGRA